MRPVCHSGTSAFCRRLHRTDTPNRLDLAGRQRSGCTQHHVRPARRRLFGTGSRAGGRRCRPVSGRNGLRYPELQGGPFRHRQLFRSDGQKAAHHDFRNGNRCFRPYSLRPDGDGFLVFHPSRQTADCRPELRAGRSPDATVCRGIVTNRRHAYLYLSECRPAQSDERNRFR